jgi:hypothetical protein
MLEDGRIEVVDREEASCYPVLNSCPRRMKMLFRHTQLRIYALWVLVLRLKGFHPLTYSSLKLNSESVSLSDMPRRLYESTAAELATGSVEHVSYETTPSAAAEWLETNGFDAAPVARDGDPVGFIHEDDSTPLILETPLRKRLRRLLLIL